jgi:hypothetical protein
MTSSPTPTDLAAARLEEVARIVDPEAFAEPRGVVVAPGFMAWPSQSSLDKRKERALAKAKAILDGQWRAISEAPRNKPVLLWDPRSGWQIGERYQKSTGEEIWPAGNEGVLHPTHWQPLPPPPEQDQ